MSNQRVFITGGASGLGAALAKVYKEQGWRVCISDLAQSFDSSYEYIKCDVTSDEDVEKAKDFLIQRWGGVDVVINNAGIAIAGDIDQVSMENWKKIIDINLLGVARGCKIFTPVFKNQGHGQFINIASLAGLVHSKQLAAYNAVKAAVVAISETLYFELKDKNIHTSVVCPSFFRTEIANSGIAANEDIEKSMKFLVNHSPRSAQTIAHKVFKESQNKKFLILPDADGKMVTKIKRVCSFEIYTALLNKVMNLKLKKILS